MNTHFKPHQLDFDWRFTDATAVAIGEHIASSTKLLLMGCPSLMKVTAPRISSGLLIERNPYHDGLEKFSLLRADTRYFNRASVLFHSFDAAVLDPPWYPNDLIQWISIALAQVRLGGEVFFVLWPTETRPSAVREHSRIFTLLERIGTLRQVMPVAYETPHFEIASLGLADGKEFERRGLLYSLTKENNKQLPRSVFEEAKTIWRRYLISSNQLAIKLGPRDVGSKICSYEVDPFTLCNTSRRNADVDKINAWTSDNVVARLENPYLIDRELRKLSAGSPSEIGMKFLADVGILLNKGEEQWGEAWIHRV